MPSWQALASDQGTMVPHTMLCVWNKVRMGPGFNLLCPSHTYRTQYALLSFFLEFLYMRQRL